MKILVYVISFVFSLGYFALIYYYLKGWLKTPSHNTRKNEMPNSRATIIVPVRNEAKNIRACIESILAQKLPSKFYEIIVVNDFSTDQTASIVSKFEKENIKLLHLKDFFSDEYATIPNKKRAISLAIEHAKFDVIITVDGDCTYPPFWLISMLQYYDRTRRKLITAPVDYYAKSNFWNYFLTMDLISLIGVTAGSIAQAKPVMANGANMLFEKDAFIAVNGYEGNEHIPSGDDIFLLQKINNKYKNAIGFIKNSNAIATTHTPDSFEEFVQQRIRWTSKSSKMIDVKVKVELVLQYLFFLFTFACLFILPFVNIKFLGAGLLMLGLKILVDSIFFTNLLSFYNKSYLIKWLLPIELLHIIYVSGMGMLTIVGSYKWKGRKV